ncbi:family 43 glycosylhydrolase [Sporosarcina sp. resist]|uniref:family 43 glycosylhydrolase n=1 Tax=Sporosarcina sp. resist TaxID=2762563 RepID=UPI00164D95F7|nr:family 43 glycosylhydrolase [Sporosarcina sp. resist]QNK90235.1 family 43 glycosylhydrolase [Sporosarcina sp. resist]
MNIVKVENIEVKTKIGNKPDLPNLIAVELKNGTHLKMNVSWNTLTPEQYGEVGTYNVEGEIQLQEYPNPLVEQRADPYIHKHTDGYYYFTGSYPEYDRIVLRRAKSIKDLSHAEETVIWSKPEKGIMSKHIWAPELHFIDGKWYVHYAAGDIDDVWAIRPYVLECSADNPLQGEWLEKGQVNTDFQSFSLDATTFENKGKRYLVWAQKVDGDTVSNLYIAEMSNPWTIKGGQTVLSTPDLEWEQQGFYVNEGAAVIKRNGKVFITYSASATDDRYVMGLLSASEDSDLVNPASWTKSVEPIFATSEKAGEYGPGHNSFTVAEDGTTDLLVYHARPYKEIEGNSLYDHNRHARVQQLFWDQQGNPYLGSPGQIIDMSKQKAIATVTVQ